MKSERNRKIPNVYLTLVLLLGGIALGAEHTFAADPVSQGGAKTAPVFATIGKDTITWREYRNTLNSEARNRFFHGRPSDNEVAAFQREVGNKMVNDVLLVQEAKRRKLKPNKAAVNEGLQKYEQRYANDPKWQDARKRVLPIITKRLENENIRDQLETLVRNVPPPTTKQLRKYFDTHPDKFTSPPQNKVSIILIRVDPSSTHDAWRKAMEEGEGLVKRLRAGEDFATMARDYSGDITAEDGGDMGYLHTGMLPGLPEKTVDKLQPGETSDPVRLMEGVAIFRLTDRIQPPPLSFEAAKPRAKELWLSEQSDLAWDTLIAKLRKQTPIHIDESRFVPLPAADTPAKAGALPEKQ